METIRSFTTLDGVDIATLIALGLLAALLVNAAERRARMASVAPALTLFLPLICGYYIDAAVSGYASWVRSGDGLERTGAGVYVLELRGDHLLCLDPARDRAWIPAAGAFGGLDEIGLLAERDGVVVGRFRSGTYFLFDARDATMRDFATASALDAAARPHGLSRDDLCRPRQLVNRELRGTNALIIWIIVAVPVVFLLRLLRGHRRRLAAWRA